MNILVTGAAGFIGSHVCEALVHRHRVIGLDNFCNFYSPHIKKKNIANLAFQKNFIMISGDIKNSLLLDKIFKTYSINCVIHLAAMAGVRPSIQNPQIYSRVNISGTLNILEACHKYDIKNIIFASSSSVYGNTMGKPSRESDPVNFPISPYAASKRAGELLCYTYHHLYNISILCLRFFTVYGPRQRPDLAIHKFTRLMLEKKEISLYGDGYMERDYTYIDDIISGIIHAFHYVQTGTYYEIFNLGGSRTITLNTLISLLEKTLNVTAIRQYLPKQPGDVTSTYADISKSKKFLFYTPTMDFEQGIVRFVQWFKSAFSI